MDTYRGSGREALLEEGMGLRGQARIQAAVSKAVLRGDLSSTIGGVEALKHLIEPVSKAISSFLQDSRGRMGRPHVASKLLGQVDPALAAYLAIRVVIDLGSGSCPLYRMAKAIGTAIEAEVRVAALEEQAPALHAAVRRSLQRKAWGPEHQAAAYATASNANGVDLPRWSKTDRVHLGIMLVDLIMDATGMIEQHTVAQRRDKTVNHVRITPAGEAWIAAANGKAGILRPDWAPTVVPPVPWTDTTAGGYLPDVLRPVPLVKRTFRGHVEKLKEADLSVVYRALNAIQGTAWRISPTILPVMRHAIDLRLPLPVLPAPEDEPLPEVPEDIASNSKSRLAYRETAKAVHIRNREAQGQRLALAQQLILAEEYRGEAEIFFPHNLDFRGRAYAIPKALNPQGTDTSKALLEFAEGKPVGDTGAAWLAIHGANVFGEDKVSFDDRVAWAEQHTENILRSASDPFGYQWWTEADKPWSFLAWCHEWAGYQEEGTSFRNRIPIALDGSCNGLQHFSAMLRDPVGGAAVNLVPSDKPQDIYQRVADRTVERLRQECAKGGENAWIARGWIDFGIDRKITKRPVMVLPYGGTMASCLEYVRAAVRERIAGGEANPYGDELPKATAFLASAIWQSIGDVVVAARRVMAWLQSVARYASRFGMPLSWSTPSGFIAHQEYKDVTHRRIKSRLRGSLVYISHYVDKETIDQSKQSLAISPNFVHSMDSAAMMLTVSDCLPLGINSYAMIHDSYGTHAADTETLAVQLRRAFIRMYEAGDVLSRFAEDIRSALPASARAGLPLPPPLGDLDLSLIRHSRYFFA